MTAKKWVVIAGTFSPGKYGGFRTGGPFDDPSEAQKWIESRVPTHEGILAEVIELEDPRDLVWPD